MLEIDQPPIYSRLVDKEDKSSPDFIQWVTQTQERLNDAFVFGRYTTVGGDETENIFVEGIDDNDEVFVTSNNLGTNEAVILTANTLENEIEVTFDVDPGDDHVLTYFVFKMILRIAI